MLIIIDCSTGVCYIKGIPLLYGFRSTGYPGAYTPGSKYVPPGGLVFWCRIVMGNKPIRLAEHFAVIYLVHCILCVWLLAYFYRNFLAPVLRLKKYACQGIRYCPGACQCSNNGVFPYKDTAGGMRMVCSAVHQDPGKERHV